MGAALAADLHREADAAGAAVTLLHYEQLIRCRAILEPAGVPAAVDQLGGKAGRSDPLTLAGDREPGKEQILGQCHAPAARLRA